MVVQDFPGLDRPDRGDEHRDQAAAKKKVTKTLTEERVPEESMETKEIQEAVEEAVEKAEHGNKWIGWLSLSTAIVAVVAALASLQSGSLANEALLKKNEAVLMQAKASDQWSYYQAKGIKGNLSAVEGATLHGAMAKKYKDEADRYKQEQAEIKKGADELEAKVDESNKEAAELLEHHHKFAYAVTLFQVAIALSAIAAMTRRKWLWIASMIIALGGLGFFGMGFGA
jgi:hypothetical protein